MIHRLEFVPEAEEGLQRLMDKIGVNSAGQVIRVALQLLEWAVDEREAGKKIGSIDKFGHATTVEFRA